MSTGHQAELLRHEGNALKIILIFLACAIVIGAVVYFIKRKL